MEGPLLLGHSTLTGGTAKFSTTTLLAGNQVVTAVYAGTGTGASDFAGSESAAPASLISTVAGGGEPTDRQAVYTTLNDPEAVAVDSAGNLFIADSNDNEVEEVNATTGAVTVVAGDGTAGYTAGAATGEVPAATAELDFPEGLAVEGLGASEVLFVADSFNNVIEKVTPGKNGFSDAEMTTYAGNYADSKQSLTYDSQANPNPSSYSGDGGPATQAELYVPIGIALDSQGDLFIADSYNNLIREVSYLGGPVGIGPQEVINTVAGYYAGPDNNGSSSNPNASLNGGGYKANGMPVPATGDKALMLGPSGVAVNSYGDIFIADTYNNIIREVVKSQYALNELTQVLDDHSIQMDDMVTVAGHYAATSGGSPSFGQSGEGGPATSASLHFPQGIFVSSSGDLFFADTFNNAIREVVESAAAQEATGLPQGDITGVAGGGNPTSGIGDYGLATSAALNQPFSLTLDGAGDIFIADTYNNAIREVAETPATAECLAFPPPSISSPWREETPPATLAQAARPSPASYPVRSESPLIARATSTSPTPPTTRSARCPKRRPPPRRSTHRSATSSPWQVVHSLSTTCRWRARATKLRTGGTCTSPTRTTMRSSKSAPRAWRPSSQAMARRPTRRAVIINLQRCPACN